MTRGQYLHVLLPLLAAVALQLNRDAFPAWAKPEFYGSYAVPTPIQPVHRNLAWAELRALVAKDAPWIAGDMHRMPSHRPVWTRFEGRPVLVVGDSQPDGWPLDADKFIVQGSSVAELADAWALYGGGCYETVVLWAGTAHFHFGHGADAYVRDMTRLITALSGPDTTAIVLGPYLPNTDASAAYAAYTRLTATGPPALYLDAPAMLGQRPDPTLLRDAAHLSERGYLALLVHTPFLTSLH